MSLSYCKKSIHTKCAALMFALSSTVTFADMHEVHIEKRDWSFKRIFGTFDRNELQRGLQVYKEVCAACHGLSHVAYRNLSALGYSAAEVKALAAQATVHDGPDQEGKMFERPGLPKDKFVSPFPNDNAAKAANNGAMPIDLSLVVKARVDGANYLYSLLTGFVTPPKNVVVETGRYYNRSFPGHFIAMPPPLHDDAVVYADGTKATVAQMASDVTTFLAWTAEPELEQRKQLGFKVVMYLLVMTGLFYALKRRIWGRLNKQL